MIIFLEHGFTENGLSNFRVKQPPNPEPAPVMTIVFLLNVFKLLSWDSNIASTDIAVT
jgi:hypothetical protein